MAGTRRPLVRRPALWALVAFLATLAAAALAPGASADVVDGQLDDPTRSDPNFTRVVESRLEADETRALVFTNLSAGSNGSHPATETAALFAPSQGAVPPDQARGGAANLTADGLHPGARNASFTPWNPQEAGAWRLVGFDAEGNRTGLQVNVTVHHRPDAVLRLSVPATVPFERGGVDQSVGVTHDPTGDPAANVTVTTAAGSNGTGPDGAANVTLPTAANGSADYAIQARRDTDADGLSDEVGNATVDVVARTLALRNRTPTPVENTADALALTPVEPESNATALEADRFASGAVVNATVRLVVDGTTAATLSPASAWSGNLTDGNLTLTDDGRLAVTRNWSYEPHRLEVTTEVAGDAAPEYALAYRFRPLDVTPPTAALEAPPIVDEDTKVNLSASNATDNHQVVSVSWSFGDGTTATGINVTHTWTNPGTYTVEVTVADADGNNDTVTHEITVRDTTPPEVETGGARTVHAGTSLAFDASETDENGEIATVEWNFGDGSPVTGTEVYHTYAAAGTYTVQVTVTDAAGNSASETFEVEVLPSEATFEFANLTLGQDRVAAGHPFTLSATVENVGTEAGMYEGQLRAGGPVLDQAAVAVPAGDTANVTFEATLEAVGTHELTVDGRLAGTIEVEEPPVVRVSGTTRNRTHVVTLAVEGASASEPITVPDRDLPDPAEPPVLLEAVTVRPAANGSGTLEFTVAPAPDAPTVAGADPPIRIDVRDPAALLGTWNATLAMDPLETDGWNATADGAALHAANGSTEVDLTSTAGGDAHRVRTATTAETSLLLAPATGAIELVAADVTPTTAEPGDAITLSATVVKTGTAPSTTTIPFTVDGEVVARETVTMDERGRRTVTVRHVVDEAGQRTCAVGGVDAGTVTVASPVSSDGAGRSVAGMDGNGSSTSGDEAQTKGAAPADGAQGIPGPGLVLASLGGLAAAVGLRRGAT